MEQPHPLAGAVGEVTIAFAWLDDIAYKALMTFYSDLDYDVVTPLWKSDRGSATAEALRALSKARHLRDLDETLPGMLSQRVDDYFALAKRRNDVVHRAIVSEGGTDEYIGMNARSSDRQPRTAEALVALAAEARELTWRLADFSARYVALRFPESANERADLQRVTRSPRGGPHEMHRATPGCETQA